MIVMKDKKNKVTFYNRQKQTGQLRCQQTATLKRKPKIVQDIGYSSEIAGTEKFRIERVKRE